MPDLFAADGFHLVVGGLTGKERWQCVIPIACNFVKSVAPFLADMTSFMETNLIPKWQAALAVDSEIAGWNYSGMVAGTMIPYRRNYPSGTYPGTVAGQSCPQNGSMLATYYSSTYQTDNPGGKVVTAKSNFGPCPEGGQAAGLLTVGQETLLGTLASALVTFGMTASGGTCFRALYSRPNFPFLLFACDTYEPRPYISTQKRRVTPRL